MWRTRATDPGQISRPHPPNAPILPAIMPGRKLLARLETCPHLPARVHGAVLPPPNVRACAPVHPRERAHASARANAHARPLHPQLVEELLTAKQMKAERLPQCYMGAVLDGHGMLGEDASREAGRAMAAYFRALPLLHKRTLGSLSDAELGAALRAGFEVGHRAALAVAQHAPHMYTYPRGSRLAQSFVLKTTPGGERLYIDSALQARVLEYGTTATVALVQGRDVVVANVGDSMASLGREDAGAYHVDLVSTRHYAADPAERARLEADHPDALDLSDPDGYISVKRGPLEGYQLAMTRALGHGHLFPLGVVPEPAVARSHLGPDALCLILASDGVWEVLSPSDAVLTVCDHLAAGHSAPESALELVRAAVELSMASNTQVGADNTSAVLFVFDDVMDDDGAEE